jgi:energy-coupling factor transport system ATP-binding protein
MIELREVTYHYPNRPQPAIDGITWAVSPGEFVLVTGPSGSGKSTLLRCLNGLVPHFSGGTISGSVTVNGLDALKAGPRALSRHVGFVAQDPESQVILEEVEAEIAFALENAAIPAAEMRVRVEEVLELLDLAPLRNRAISTLSGGERQRVAIGAALALRPGTLVLDEPTSQLDPQSADDVLRALVRLNEDLGLTIILAEHRLERILKYVDRLTYVVAGRIAADGPVRDALPELSSLPPLVELGRALGWQPLPVTVKEAQRFPRPSLSVPAPGPRRLPGVIALEVERLSFAYNGKPTVNGVGLSVRRGEAVALLGRNGAGKTTLLKCIVGLLSRKGGEVRVLGQTTHGREVADICRDVAYLPQNPDDLLFAETVTDEMRTTLRNHRMTLPESAIAAQLERLGLAEAAAVYPRDLSVGQRQRVAFGAVTVTAPSVILLDEPTRGLDSASKNALVGLLRRWLDDGAALLLVTHDVEFAALIADRAVVMSQGEIIADGPTADVLGGSPHFAPQMARLFPGTGVLTLTDVLDRLPTKQTN